MTPHVDDQLDSSSLWNLFYFYCNQVYVTLFLNLSLTSFFNCTSYIGLVEHFQFDSIYDFKYLTTLSPYDEFQFELLKIFCVILFTNTLLLVIIWQVYGKQICQRFMKPGEFVCPLF